MNTLNLKFYRQWVKGEPAHILFIGCLVYVLVLVPTIFAGIYWSVLGAIFGISVPLCLAFGIFAAVKGRFEGSALALLTLVACIIGSMSLVEYLYITQGDVVRDISVLEARNYPNGRIFDFRDARLECQYSGYYSTTSRDRQTGRETTHSYFVCPLVSENWNPAEPVPAWARQESSRYEKNPSGTFAAIAPHERDEYNKAIENAREEHGLHTQQDAPVLQWVKSLDRYQDYLSRQLLGGGITIIVLFAIWAIGAGIFTAKSYKQPRSHQAGKPRSQSTLTTCPYCHVRVRKDRLQKHKQKCPKRKGHVTKAQAEISKKKAIVEEQPPEMPKEKTTVEEQPPYKARARIKAVPQGIAITLPDPRSFYGPPLGQRLTMQRWMELAKASLVILGCWGIGGFFLIRFVVQRIEHLSQASLFDAIVLVVIVIAFLAGWGIIGIVAFTSLLYGLFGRERVLFHEGRMTIKITLFGITIRKTSYEFSRIKDFRYIPDPPQKQGHLQFAYEEHTIECLRGLNGPEAQILFKQISDIMAYHCYAVEQIVFGTTPLPDDAPYRTLRNPDVSDLTFPFVHLKHLSIQTDSYDFYRVERFLTYAVSYVGEKYLKQHVEVHLYGNPENLQSNLRHSLTNLCKQVHEHHEEKNF